MCFCLSGWNSRVTNGLMIVIAAASVLALVGVIHVTRVMKRGRNYKVVDQFWTMGPFTYFFSKLLSRRFKLCVLSNPCQLKNGSLPWKPSCWFSQYIHNWMLKSKRKKENSKSFYAKNNQLEVWWSKCCLSLTNSRTKGRTSVFLFILLNNSFTSFLIAERKF